MKRLARDILHASALWLTVALAMLMLLSILPVGGSLVNRFRSGSGIVLMQSGALMVTWGKELEEDPNAQGGILAPLWNKGTLWLLPRAGKHYAKDAVSIPLWMLLACAAAVLAAVHRRARSDAAAKGRSLQWLVIRRLAMGSLVALLLVAGMELLGLSARLSWSSRTTRSTCMVRDGSSLVVTTRSRTANGIMPPLTGKPLGSVPRMALVPLIGTQYGQRAASLPLWMVAAALSGIYAVAWRRSRPASVGTCVKCGYEMTGLRAGARCPECGTSHVGSGLSEIGSSRA